MFIKTNDRIVNLKNVSNINVLKNRKRIIFNMNYNIEMDIESSNKKLISDYVYWDSKSLGELEDNLLNLKKSDYFKDNFINQVDSGFINMNEISSIKLSEKKFRVIFNLSHPVTFKDYSGTDKITSEFVYVNCKNKMKYLEYLDYLNILIKGESLWLK